MTASGPIARDSSGVSPGGLVWVAVVAYLIFIAFQLTGPLQQQGDISRFLRAPPPAPRDAVENMLLGLPIGALALFAQWLRGRAGESVGLVLALALTAAVAVPMELAQSYMIERTPSWWDAGMLVLGAGAGYALAWLAYAALGRRLDLSRLSTSQLLVLLVALAWPLRFWVPRRLELSPNEIEAALAPLGAGTALDPTAQLSQAAAWLAVAALLRLLIGSGWRPFLALAGLVALAWLGLLLSPGREVTWNALIAGAAAVALAGVLRRDAWLKLVFAALLLLAASFWTSTLPSSGRGLWRPLAELGSLGRLDAAIALGRYYGLLAAPLVLQPLAAERRLRWWIVAAIGLALIAVLAIGGWLTGHVLTTPLIAYALGVAIFVLSGLGWSGPDPARLPARPGAPPAGWRHETAKHRVQRALLRAALLGGVLVLGIWVMIQLPFVPYNVRELFIGRALFAGLLLMAAFLVFTSTAPALLANLLLRVPGVHILQPLLYPLMATLAWLLLRYAVSAESLHDILGSPVLGWPGDWELYLRFLALAAVPLLCVMLSVLLLDGIRGQGWGRGIGHAALAVMMAVPWAIAAKWLVVDLASTDNLIELVAWEHGGFALLGITLAFGLVALNGALLGISADEGGTRRWALLVIATPILAVTSWTLMSVSLAPGALTFLLGPERGAAFGTVELMLLWLVVHLGGALLFGAGRWVVGPLVAGPRRHVPAARRAAPEAAA